MKNIGKNIKYTKTQGNPPNKYKPMETLETNSNHIFTKIIDPQQQITTYLTGRSSVTSSIGNKYLFILYDYDINCILVGPMNNRTDKEFIHVFQYLHVHLTTRVLKPNYIQLDNEAYP